jgi:hypothetical protein
MELTEKISYPSCQTAMGKEMTANSLGTVTA